MEVDQLDDLNDLNLNGKFAAELKEMNLTHLNTFKSEIEGNARNQIKIEADQVSNAEKNNDNNINNIKNVTTQIYKLDGNITQEVRDRDNKIITKKDKERVNLTKECVSNISKN